MRHDKSGESHTVLEGVRGSHHQLKWRLVLNVGERGFEVHFAGVLRGPNLRPADDVLLPELLLIRPRQRVTGQRGQAVIWVIRRRRSWRGKKNRKTLLLLLITIIITVIIDIGRLYVWKMYSCSV